MDITLSEIAALIDAGKGSTGYFGSELEKSFVPLFTKLQSLSDWHFFNNNFDSFCTDSNIFRINFIDFVDRSFI